MVGRVSGKGLPLGVYRLTGVSRSRAWCGRLAGLCGALDISQQALYLVETVYC